MRRILWFIAVRMAVTIESGLYPDRGGCLSHAAVPRTWGGRCLSREAVTDSIEEEGMAE
jgi:hypothetical protein